MEFSKENVGLVDFVCHHYKLLLGCEFDHCLDILLRQTCTCWVSRINNDDCSDIGSLINCLLVCTLYSVQICSPALGFIEVVWDAFRIENGKRGSVKRVLRDRYEDSGIWTGGNDMQEGVDS